MSDQPWTEAEVAFVRQKLDEGCSLKDIARALFRTKSAVCGLKKRRGWSAKRAPGKPPPVQVSLPVPKLPEPPLEPVVVAAPAPEPVPVPEPVARLPRPVLPAVAPARTCQWPRGEKPNWNWCGAPVVPGRPYCLAHCQRAYVGGSITRRAERAA